MPCRNLREYTYRMKTARSNEHKNETNRLEVRFPTAAWIDAIDEAARKSERSMSAFVRLAVKDALKRAGVQEPKE